jgi:hypothetical protein
MSKFPKSCLLLACCSATLLLAACGDDNGIGSNATPPAPTTASALAVSQIDTQTCDSSDPQTINGQSFNDDQDQSHDADAGLRGEVSHGNPWQ